MHQSTPPAPSPPPPSPQGLCGAFARHVSPKGGAFANFALPGCWAQVELTDALWKEENEKEKRVVVFFLTFQSNGLHPEKAWCIPFLLRISK